VTSVSSTNGTSANFKTQELIKQMRDDGLALKKSAASTQQQISFVRKYSYNINIIKILI